MAFYGTEKITEIGYLCVMMATIADPDGVGGVNDPQA